MSRNCLCKCFFRSSNFLVVCFLLNVHPSNPPGASLLALPKRFRSKVCSYPRVVHLAFLSPSSCTLSTQRPVKGLVVASVRGATLMTVSRCFRRASPQPRFQHSTSAVASDVVVVCGVVSAVAVPGTETAVPHSLHRWCSAATIVIRSNFSVIAPRIDRVVLGLTSV